MAHNAKSVKMTIPIFPPKESQVRPGFLLLQMARGECDSQLAQTLSRLVLVIPAQFQEQSPSFRPCQHDYRITIVVLQAKLS